MSWLEPTLAMVANLPSGRVTTVCHEKAVALRESKKRRWRRWWFKRGKELKKSAVHREKRRQWEKKNKDHIREYQRGYYAKNRKAVLNRQRMYYATNEKRRKYLRDKQREYRKKQKAEKLSTQNTRNPLTN